MSYLYLNKLQTFAMKKLLLFIRKQTFNYRFNFNPSWRCLSEFNQQQNSNHYNSFTKSKKLLIGTTIVALIGFNFYDKTKKYVKNQSRKKENVEIGVFKEGLPLYTMEEVAKHSVKEHGIWVTYKEGVYDISKFINSHPGGDQILLAAGSSVEPFWILYAVHKNPHVLEMLETYRIGNVSKLETLKLTEGMIDPYSNDPLRHSALKSTSCKPFNAETHQSLLVQSFLTPNELFYVRNHLPVPEIDPETYELEVEIEGQTETITFNLNDLKKFQEHTITATVMCAGNRRSEMCGVKPVKGLSWGPAAVGNATWTGVKLRDVLLYLGIDEYNNRFKHIQFEGADFDPTGKTYGGSIPFWKGIDRRGDVLLAYEMNGEPIPRDHGFPIRVIVPGVVGARNVKWLNRIVLSEHESPSHWQQNDYKGFSPSVDWDTVDYTKSPAIQELPVISAICIPSPGQQVRMDENGRLLVKGYAWSGGGQKIVRVDVTTDGGQTWHVADFNHQDSAEPPQHWSWTLWSARIPVPENHSQVEIWAKAVDSCYNTQPESFANIWNLRGVLSNAYHRVIIGICKDAK